MDIGGSGILFGMGDGGGPRDGVSADVDDVVAGGPVLISGGGGGPPFTPSKLRFSGGGREVGLKEYRLGDTEALGASSCCDRLVGGVETVLGASDGRHVCSRVFQVLPPLLGRSVEALPFAWIKSEYWKSGWPWIDSRIASRCSADFDAISWSIDPLSGAGAIGRDCGELVSSCIPAADNLRILLLELRLRDLPAGLSSVVLPAIVSLSSGSSGPARCSEMDEDGERPLRGLLFRRESSSSDVRSSSEGIVGSVEAVDAGRLALRKLLSFDGGHDSLSGESSRSGVELGPRDDVALGRGPLCSTFSAITDALEHSERPLAGFYRLGGGGPKMTDGRLVSGSAMMQ